MAVALKLDDNGIVLSKSSTTATALKDATASQYPATNRTNVAFPWNVSIAPDCLTVKTRNSGINIGYVAASTEKLTTRRGDDDWPSPWPRITALKTAS